MIEFNYIIRLGEMMKVSKLSKEDLSENIIDKILFEGLEYSGEAAECAMVLGSMTAPKYRVPVASNLYKIQKVNKLLLCGGKIRETEYGKMTEVQLMKNKAIELGVKETDLLFEENSLTTKENIICALLPLEREFKLSNLRKIILVTTAYHMRRSMLMAKTYFPNWIKIIPCPAEDIKTRRDNWFCTEEGITRARQEAWKIVCYINDGSIPDFEI